MTLEKAMKGFKPKFGNPIHIKVVKLLKKLRTVIGMAEERDRWEEEIIKLIK